MQGWIQTKCLATGERQQVDAALRYLGRID